MSKCEKILKGLSRRERNLESFQLNFQISGGAEREDNSELELN